LIQPPGEVKAQERFRRGAHGSTPLTMREIIRDFPPIVTEISEAVSVTI